MSVNLENSAVSTGLEKASFHSNPKERQCKECSNYHTIILISHASKVMLKILQARLQQYVNCELPDVQTGCRKGRGTRNQIVIKKAREFQKNIYFCFIDYAKAFDCVDHNKLWKILQEMEIPDHLTCLLRNLYAGQEATVRTGHGTTHWFQIGKGVHQGCILSPCRVCVLVTQLWPTLWDPMDYSPPGFFVHGIFQARILKWVSISFSRGSKQGSNPGLLHCRQMLYPQNY